MCYVITEWLCNVTKYCVPDRHITSKPVLLRWLFTSCEIKDWPTAAGLANWGLYLNGTAVVAHLTDRVVESGRGLRGSQLQASYPPVAVRPLLVFSLCILGKRTSSLWSFEFPVEPPKRCIYFSMRSTWTHTHTPTHTQLYLYTKGNIHGRLVVFAWVMRGRLTPLLWILPASHMDAWSRSLKVNSQHPSPPSLSPAWYSLFIPFRVVIFF